MSKVSRKRANSIASDCDNISNKNRKTESDNVVIINREIKTLNDLISLGESYDPNKKYNINLFKLNKIVPVLMKLKNTIGMENVKKSIVGQIIYFIQDFQDKNQDMLHTVIQGPPGVGKTMLGHIIGQIYWELEIIQTENVVEPTSPELPSKSLRHSKHICPVKTRGNPSTKNKSRSRTKLDDFIVDDDDDLSYYSESEAGDSSYCSDSSNCSEPSYKKSKKSQDPNELKFKIAKRSDLIAKYLGRTAAKTQEVIDGAVGGVLFIDEAYSLGNSEGGDSYAKECIDTINQNLTEKKNQLLVIIAGYEQALEECFFSYNEGLNRRFPFRYTIDAYTHDELAQIFCKMVREINTNPGFEWDVKIPNNKLNQFFKDNYLLFPNFGGDVESFLLSVKIQHGIRVFCLPSEEKRNITLEDLSNALKIYRVNKEKK